MLKIFNKKLHTSFPMRSLSQLRQLNIVCLDYNKLQYKNTNYSSDIEEAYGEEGFGICIVKNIPNYIETRQKLLPLAYQLANLPKDKLTKLEKPEVFYGVGWSHGKEQFQGKYDTSKGSFYANPIYDEVTVCPETLKNKDSWANIWPKEDLPELEYAFKNLGKIITKTASVLAIHIDKYVSKRIKDFPENRFYNMITHTTQYCGRLLHYYPVPSRGDSGANNTSNNWCGWHNDHGALTGLTSAMYINQEGKINFFDSNSGLFIRKRNAEIVKASIPKDCVAFQIGETSQILSGGYLVATPHCVVHGKKLEGTGISRNTFALFHAPEWNESMKIPANRRKEDAFVREAYGIPKLQDRWQENQNYWEFSTKTLQYYN